MSFSIMVPWVTYSSGPALPVLLLLNSSPVFFIRRLHGRPSGVLKRLLTRPISADSTPLSVSGLVDCLSYRGKYTGWGCKWTVLIASCCPRRSFPGQRSFKGWHGLTRVVSLNKGGKTGGLNTAATYQTSSDTFIPFGVSRCELVIINAESEIPNSVHKQDR